MSEIKKIVSNNNPFLLGHVKAENEFIESFNNGRLHHSWIITGNKGIGKATFVYRIVRYIFSNCKQSSKLNLRVNLQDSFNNIENNLFDDLDKDSDFEFSETFCDDVVISDDEKNNIIEQLNVLDTSLLKLDSTHPIFERLLQGGITDFMLIERQYNDTGTKLKSEIGIEQIRRLKEFFSKTSAEDNYKIALIDSIDDMNVNSSNALLKVLEEAPNKSLLFLISHNYKTVLDTIKSRCRVLRFMPLSSDNMELLIKFYLPNISKIEMQQLIHISSGSIGEAINFYTNGGFSIFNLFYTILFDNKNSVIIELLNFIGIDEVRFHLFQMIVLNFVNQLILFQSGVDVLFFSSFDKFINSFCKDIELDVLFDIRTNILNDFNLVHSLNLDYGAVIITIFERLKNAYR